MTVDCIVTGGGGMLGQAVVRTLRAAGRTPLVLTGRSQLDLTRATDLEALPPVREVVHLAALSGVDLAWSDPERLLGENLQATLNLLGWCRRNGVKRLVFASSYVYGAPQYLPVDESHPVHPANPYAASKWLGEQLCQEYSRWGIEVAALRFFNLIGPHQTGSFLVPTILEQLRHRDRIELFSSRPKRDYLDVEDAARACLIALGCPLSPSFQAFNIGSGTAVGVGEVLELLFQVSGKRLPVHFSEQLRPGEVMEVVADIARARRVLGWEPRVSLEESMRRIWLSATQEVN